MNQIQHFHHYTTIATLALILKNRTLRFNRLDHVDDVGESQNYGTFNLSRFIFVSCWTDTDEESIPLWHMYSKGMTGVRLSLPIDPFDYKPLVPHPVFGGNATGQMLSFLSLDEIFTSEYMVNPSFMFNKRAFIKKIEYIEETELPEIRKQAVQIKVDIDGKAWTEVEGPTKLAGYKSKKWEFQGEVRYIIMIYPSPTFSQKKDPISTWVDNLSQHLFKSLQSNTSPVKDYFDVNLSQDAIDNIKVTLAPLATESDRIIVDALLQKYTKSGSLSISSLAHAIRSTGK